MPGSLLDFLQALDMYKKREMDKPHAAKQSAVNRAYWNNEYKNMDNRVAKDSVLTITNPLLTLVNGINNALPLLPYRNTTPDYPTRLMGVGKDIYPAPYPSIVRPSTPKHTPTPWK